MPLTITPGYLWQTADVVTPARLNRAISGQTLAAAPLTLLGVPRQGAAAGDPQPESAPVAEIPVSDQGLALLAAATPAAFTDVMRGMFDFIYPVGHIYFSAVAANPADLFGVGVWERYAQGRAIVGVDESDADFAAAGTVAGAKAAPITNDQLPAKTITLPEATITTDSGGTHSHKLYVAWSGGNLGAPDAFDKTSQSVAIAGEQDATNLVVLNNGMGMQLVENGGAHTHTAKVPSVTTEPLGSGAARSNLQPSVAVYAWRRTA